MTINAKIILLTLCLVSYIFIIKNISTIQNSEVILKDTIPKDIPIYKNGATSLDYLYSKKFAEILSLENLDKGVDSIEMRIWYHFSFIDTGQLVILKSDKNKWEAMFYTFNYAHDNSISSIRLIQKSVENRIPKSSWSHFIEKLYNSNIKTLPDQSRIIGYSVHTDGDGVGIEVATSLNYRIYGYQMLGSNRQKYKEVENMESIIDLITDEFDFFPLRSLTNKQLNAKAGR